MRWIWRALTRRLLLKFTALLCACVLWVYVDSTLRAAASEPLGDVSESVAEQTFRVAFQIPPKAVGPLEVRGPEGKPLPVNNVYVRVTVRGPATAVRSLRENLDVRGSIGVPGGLREGPVSLPISELNIALPQGRGLEVVTVKPRRLEFLLVPHGTPPTAEVQ